MTEIGYTWKRSRYGSRQSYKRSDHFGRWVVIAIVLALLSHVIVILAMNKMPVFLGGDESRQVLAADQVVIKNVSEREYLPEVEQATLPEPPKDADSLLEDMAMLEEIPEDMEVDFSPTIDETKLPVKMEMPPLKGDEFSTSKDLTEGMKMTADPEDLGNTDEFLKPEIGQITIDSGLQNADKYDPDAFNKELAKGAGGDAENGVLDGYTPLAEMSRLSQTDLENAKGMIGSDLLYEFNKSTLRDSAKNSLMKVVLLIDKNPNMKCWIEGHTDLIGTDAANLTLSYARAQAVKDWLVESIKIEPSRLYVRGLGKSQPIVTAGDQDAQAINRRVEIKMRRKAPPEIAKQRPRKSPADASQPKPRQPRIIKPKRDPNKGIGKAVPVEEPKTNIPPSQPITPPKPPKAIPVEEPSSNSGRAPGKAIPVE